MYVIGLTGPMASGKSTVAQLFREAGAEVWDADVAVHHLYNKNKDLQADLVALLGTDALDTTLPKPQINRGKIAEKIRQDGHLLDKIGKIVFPYLIPAWLKWVKRRKSELLILEAPLLFEAGLEKYCNTIVTCHTPATVRKIRALQRETVDEMWWELMTQTQMCTTAYAEKSDSLLDCTTLDAPTAFVAEMKGKYLNG